MTKSNTRKRIEESRRSTKEMLLIRKVQNYMGEWHTAKKEFHSDICPHNRHSYSCCRCLYGSLHFESEKTGIYDLIKELNMPIGYKLESAYGVSERIMDILDRAGVELDDFLNDKDDTK